MKLRQQEIILESRIRISYKFIELYRKLTGKLPDKKHKVWRRLGNLFHRRIELNWAKRGLRIDLENPRTFAEKVEWLKLNYHDPIFFEFADKILVRDYVMRKTGSSELLNEIFSVNQSVDDIDPTGLPDDYVIKPSHWSGLVTCISKENLLESIDISAKYSQCLLKPYDQRKRKVEWPYWNLSPRLIAEEYLEDQFLQLVDYKWFCFNGVPKFVQVSIDRFPNPKYSKIRYFDCDWNSMPFSHSKYSQIPLGKMPPPPSLAKMIKVSRQLSSSLPFVRVDLYDVDGKCKFGELTLYPESGMNSIFAPDVWNHKIGDWLQLPTPKIDGHLAYSPI